jgi:Glyoxalase/Bleomycin resistance protein/Dioxygenase superfamily
MAAHGLLTHFIRILASVDHAIDKLVRLIQDPATKEHHMVAIKAVAHFSIPVSDIARSTRFYTEIVGCKLCPRCRAGT